MYSTQSELTRDGLERLCKKRDYGKGLILNLYILFLIHFRLKNVFNTNELTRNGLERLYKKRDYGKGLILNLYILLLIHCRLKNVFNTKRLN